MRPDGTVYVIDDDVAVRQSLAFLLSSDGLAVVSCATAEAFLEGPAESAVGCIVSDVRMPGIDGIEFLKRLHARGIQLPVIIMTGHADVSLAVQAMKQGAVDFIEKPFDDEVLLRAVRLALEDASVERMRLEKAAHVQARLQTLSERERQIMGCLVEGKANKVTAIELGISPRTVEIHRANVMHKMQAGSLSELVRMAISAEDDQNHG